MYRSPEMLDLYLNYPINEALDIWVSNGNELKRCDSYVMALILYLCIQAFGCIIFYLVCGFHPFEDSAKLAILNANYNLPPCDTDFEPFHNLIRKLDFLILAIYLFTKSTLLLI